VLLHPRDSFFSGRDVNDDLFIYDGTKQTTFLLELGSLSSSSLASFCIPRTVVFLPLFPPSLFFEKKKCDDVLLKPK